MNMYIYIHYGLLYWIALHDKAKTTYMEKVMIVAFPITATTVGFPFKDLLKPTMMLCVA